ncbi:MAG: spore maturation protein [Christensenellales bacterium]|jgi:spore maturation protein B
MSASDFIVPVFFLSAIALSAYRHVPAYDAFVRGAAEGLRTALRVAPYLIAVMVMISLFNASGLMELMTNLFSPALRFIGLPPEIAPFALVRPFSGAGALGAMQDLFVRLGPDSQAGRAASLMMGSTETIFYTVAVYFGVAGVRKTRHTIPAALFSMLAGMVASGWICRLWHWGS